MSDFQKIKPNYVHLSRRAIKHFQARSKKNGKNFLHAFEHVWSLSVYGNHWFDSDWMMKVKPWLSLPEDRLPDCIAGRHGSECEETCSEACAGDNNPCDKIDGACSLGCDPGYTGTFCEKGMRLFYLKGSLAKVIKHKDKHMEYPGSSWTVRLTCKSRCEASGWHL